MDLDNIKKVWQVTDIKPAISDEKIQKILDNKGKSAFEKLVKYEKIGLILGAICIPISFTFRDTATIIFYLCSILLILIWQVYKYKFLKGINLSEMGIIEISTKINRYKKYISREFIIGIAWAFAFTGFWCFNVIYKDISKNTLENSMTPLIVICIVYVVMLSTLIVIAWALYKTMYTTNIAALEKSIKESEEFEKDNRE